MNKRSRKNEPFEVTLSWQLEPNPKNEIQPTPDPDSPTGVLIPANIEEAVAELEKMLHPDFIEEARTITLSGFVSSQHFGLSMWMRGDWGLWKDNWLTQHLRTQGITHSDGMSSFLLGKFWQHLQQGPTADGLRGDRI